MEIENEKEVGKKGGKKPPHAFTLMPSRAPLELHCEWGECEMCFDNMPKFRTHVQNHLYDLFHTVKGTENECESFMNMACDWRDCDSDCGRGFAELVRHVYFHAFHARLKSVGSYIVQIRNAPACKLEDTSRNVIPELPEQLICHWGFCERVFDDPSLFYEHCNSHVEELPASKHPPGGVKCHWEGCEQSVQNRHRMREHLRSHTQERIVACSTCGTLFANNTKLLDHLLRQKDISDGFECSHCNKAFSTERLLRDHMRNHVNHYKCPLCEMTCPSPANLRAHLNSRHNENRPHACTVCPKRFKIAGDLRKHQEIHSESSFACNVADCKYVCVSYKTLLVHFKREHEGGLVKRRYKCHLCPSQEYSTGGLLTKHLRRAHNFQWPPGHRRFRYKPNSEGFYQLQTLRYESVELSEQMLTDEDGNEHEEGTHKTPGKDKRNRFRAFRIAELKTIRDPEEEPSQEPSQEDDSSAADYSYNLEMLGDVALQQGSKRHSGSGGGRVLPSGGSGNVHLVDKTGTMGVAGGGVNSPEETTTKPGQKHGSQIGLHNARRKLCMEMDDANGAKTQLSKTRRGKIKKPTPPSKKAADKNRTSPNKVNKAGTQCKRRDLSSTIEHLIEEKTQSPDGKVSQLRSSNYSGYVDEVSCSDSGATIRAERTEEGAMEITWSSDGRQNLEMDLPEAFSDCDAISISYNGQETTVPLMSMPVVIFGDEVHHRKQRTPVKLIAHDDM